MVQVLCDFIAKSNMSINSIVNCPHIEEYFQLKGWSLPNSCSTISKIIVDHADEVVCNFKKLFDGKKISIQIDEWTNNSNKRFMSVVATDSTEYVNLGLCEISGSATSANLLNLLKQKLELCRISLENVIGITSDGASVMKRLQQDSGKIQQSCYAHAIHLAVVDYLMKNQKVTDSNFDDIDEDELSEEMEPNIKEKFRSALTKMSKIISTFSHSALLSEALEAYQIADNVQVLKLKKFMKIRWNSIFQATERFLKVHPQVYKTIIDHNNKKSNVFIVF